MKKKSIHTKFPLAKIKKIIQENEEIGKLKHSTPFVICLLKSPLSGDLHHQARPRTGSLLWRERKVDSLAHVC